MIDIDKINTRVETLEAALAELQGVLPERTILLVLKDLTGLPMRDIKVFISGLESVHEYFTVEQDEVAGHD